MKMTQMGKSDVLNMNVLESWLNAGLDIIG